MISQKQLEILRHSLGYDLKGFGNNYRNYYASGKDCDGYDLLLDLVNCGLMYSRDCDDYSKDLIYFYVTEAGKKIVEDHKPKSKKLTAAQKKYQAFLDFDGSMSFIEFCKFYDRENKEKPY